MAELCQELDSSENKVPISHCNSLHMIFVVYLLGSKCLETVTYERHCLQNVTIHVCYLLHDSTLHVMTLGDVMMGNRSDLLFLLFSTFVSPLTCRAISYRLLHIFNKSFNILMKS